MTAVLASSPKGVKAKAVRLPFASVTRRGWNTR
jgi:hypothetical protein